ncbi:hypothetical protein [Haloterrigena salifodinae]|uniref:hypothetical protein n=1 Tax=Haloterrigena salifodinae TaxID=2675099 RepID=UPI002012F10B|nr:hypothetical protein [Haloterrigena salifodinae]
MVDSTGESDANPVSGIGIDDLKQWILLDGNRFLLAAVLAAAFALALLSLTISNLAPLADPQSLFDAFSGLISGNFTLITVVVSINQLLLSRELKSPGELESEIEETADYREVVESVTNRPVPAEPRRRAVRRDRRHDRRPARSATRD